MACGQQQVPLGPFLIGRANPTGRTSFGDELDDLRFVPHQLLGQHPGGPRGQGGTGEDANRLVPLEAVQAGKAWS